MVNQETVRETHHQMAMSSTVAPPGSDTESGLDGGVELGERLESDSSPSPPSLPVEVTPRACPEPAVMTCTGRAHLWQEDNLSKNLLEASDTSDHRLLMFSPYSTTNNPGTFSAWVPGSPLSPSLAPGLYGNGDRKSGDKGRLGLAAAGGKDVSQVPVFERLQSVSRYTSYQFSHHPDNINRYIDLYRAVHTVGKAGHSHRHAPTLEPRLAEPHRPLVTHIIQNRGSNRSPRACLVDLSQLRQLYSSYRKFPHLWDSSNLDTCNRSPQGHRMEDVTQCDVTSMEGGSRDFPVLAAVRETVNNVPARHKQGRKKLPQQPQTFPCLPPIGHTQISPAAVTNNNNSNSHNSGQPAAMTGMPTAESDRDGLEDEDTARVTARAPEGKLWRNPAVPSLDLTSLDTECSSTSPRSTDGQTVNTGSGLPASSSTYTSCDSLHETSREKTSTRFSDVYPDLTRPASTSDHQGDVSSMVSTSPAQGVNTPDTRDTPTWPPLVTTQQTANGEVRLTQTSSNTLLRRDYSHLIIEITNHPDHDLDKPNVRPAAHKPKSKSSQECPDKQSGQLTSSSPQEVTAGHLRHTKSLSRLDQSPRLSFTPDLVDKNPKNGVSKTQRHHIEVPHSHRSRQGQHGDVIRHEKPLEVQGVEYSTGSHTWTSSRRPEMADTSRDDQGVAVGVALKKEGRAGDMSVRLREGGKSERNKEEKEKKNQLSKSQGGKARHRIVHRKNPVIQTSGRKILSTTGLVSHVTTTHKGQREELGDIQQVKGHKKDTRRGGQSYRSCQWHQMVDSGECGFIVRSLPAHTTARPSGHHDNDDNDNDTDDEEDAVVDSCVCESVELYYHNQPHTATLSGRSQIDDIDACLTIQAGVKSGDTEISDNQHHQVGLDCHMALSPDPTTTLHPTNETTSDATSQPTRTQETHPDGAPYLQLKENSDPQRLKVRRFSSGDSATLESGGEDVRMKQTNKGCLPRRPSSLEVSIPSRSNRQTLCPRVISLEGHENQGQGYSESPRIPSVTGLVGEVKVKRELQIYAHVRKGVCCDRQREVIQRTSKKSKTRGRRELLSLSGPKSDYGYFRL